MPAHPTPRPCFTCACRDHSWSVATKGYIVMVSVQDDYLLHARAWTAAVRDRTVYAQANIKRQRVYMHQIIEQRVDSGEIDHWNRWGLDNRRPNLRDATRASNSCNTRPRRTRNRTSVFKGVSWSKDYKLWVAYIGLPTGKTAFIGSFGSEEAAALAYDEEALKHRGEFAYLNFPRAA